MNEALRRWPNGPIISAVSHLLVGLLVGWQETFAVKLGSDQSEAAVASVQVIIDKLATDVDRDSTAETSVHPELRHNFFSAPALFTSLESLPREHTQEVLKAGNVVKASRAAAFEADQNGGAGGWLHDVSVQLAMASRLITDLTMHAASGIQSVWKNSYAAPAMLAKMEVSKPSSGWLQKSETRHNRLTTTPTSVDVARSSMIQDWLGGIKQLPNAFKRMFQAPPTVAFLVLGWPNQHRPPWSRAEDSIVMWSSPQACQDCPNSSQAGPAARLNYPKGWWCAQRHYWDGLARLMNEFPDKDYYFLADSDTLVFPEVLDSMMGLLENEVLSKDEDLYMGDVHCYLEPCRGTSCNCKNPFVASGGGVLLRGKTMRKLKASKHLGSCAQKAFKEWCWHHLDWTINECMREMDVQPRFHKSFQQFSGPWHCPKDAVACHAVKTASARKRVWAQRRHTTLNLNAAWARPLQGSHYTGEIGPPVFPPATNETAKS